MIIVLTGEKLAGKGTTADFLVKHYTAQTFRFSQPLSDIAQRLHLENSRANLVKLGTTLREHFGDDILAKILLQDILASTAPLKIIDGMRYLSEYELLKDLPDFHLIYVTASVAVRYARMQGRNEKSDEASMLETEFVQREQDVTERQIPKLGQLAEVTINNAGTIQELYSKVDRLYLSIKK